MNNLCCRIIILLSFCLPLIACPYKSEVFIDLPSVKVDPRLTGTWRAKSIDSIAFRVTKTDENMYRIYKKTLPAGEEVLYNGFLSEIDAVTYLNIYELQASILSYHFFKVIIPEDGNTLTLIPVSDKIKNKFSTPQELKSYFRNNQKNNFFFGKEEVQLIKK